MNRHRLVTVPVVALVAAFVAPAAHAGPAAKNLTVAQVTKKIDTAITKTAQWQRTNPFVITVTTKDNAGRSTDVYTVDSAGGVRTDDEGGTVAIIIGRDTYLPMAEDGLAPFEVILARELGLDTTPTWVKAGPVTVNGVEDPNFELNQIRSQVRPHPAMFEAIYPKRSAITSLVTGKTETIKVTTKAFTDAQWGAVPASVLSFTTTGGRLTEYLFSSNGVVMTITYKPYTGRITAPRGPHFDLGQLTAHPSYPSAYATHRAELIMDAMVREAYALAASDGRTALTSADWVEVANTNSAELYDKGVGFVVVYDRDRSFPMCAEFTAIGAALRSSSCEALGFTRA